MFIMNCFMLNFTIFSVCPLFEFLVKKLSPLRVLNGFFKSYIYTKSSNFIICRQRIAYYYQPTGNVDCSLFSIPFNLSIGSYSFQVFYWAVLPHSTKSFVEFVINSINFLIPSFIERELIFFRCNET